MGDKKIPAQNVTDIDSITLRADMRVLGLLGSILLSIVIAALSMHTTIAKMSVTVENIDEKNDAAANAIRDVEGEVKVNGTRLIRLEEWRTMTTDWQEIVKESNPELAIPPSPDEAVPSTRELQD